MTTGTDRRREALRQVEACVCRDRQNTYGDAEDNFDDIANVLNILLEKKLRQPLTAKDIATFDIAQKLCRIKTSPNHLDNWIDGAGYFVCGAGIVLAADKAADDLVLATDDGVAELSHALKAAAE